jgi:hypothetical protein
MIDKQAVKGTAAPLTQEGTVLISSGVSYSAVKETFEPNLPKRKVIFNNKINF